MRLPAAVSDSRNRLELAVLKATVEPVREKDEFSEPRACRLVTVALSSGTPWSMSAVAGPRASRFASGLVAGTAKH
jgi:hypothetical protein